MKELYSALQSYSSVNEVGLSDGNGNRILHLSVK